MYFSVVVAVPSRRATVMGTPGCMPWRGVPVPLDIGDGGACYVTNARVCTLTRPPRDGAGGSAAAVPTVAAATATVLWLPAHACCPCGAARGVCTEEELPLHAGPLTPAMYDTPPDYFCKWRNGGRWCTVLLGGHGAALAVPTRRCPARPSSPEWPSASGMPAAVPVERLAMSEFQTGFRRVRGTSFIHTPFDRGPWPLAAGAGRGTHTAEEEGTLSCGPAQHMEAAQARNQQSKSPPQSRDSHRAPSTTPQVSRDHTPGPATILKRARVLTPQPQLRPPLHTHSHRPTQR